MPTKVYDMQTAQCTLVAVQARRLIQDDELEALADGDELIQARRTGHFFSDWHEGQLNFRPTYKFRHMSEVPLE